jgi:hypothetical protein
VKGEGERGGGGGGGGRKDGEHVYCFCKDNGPFVLLLFNLLIYIIYITNNRTYI